MKKFAMILLTILLAFGLSSPVFASGDSSEDEKVTFENGVTTIVKTKTEVTHGEKVKVEKSTDHKVKKESKKSTYKDKKVKVVKEKHPHKKKLYRDVKIITHYKVTKVVSWDKVIQTDTIKTKTTPVTITKTTVTTIKHKGAPGSNGKVISKDKETYVDKEFGETTVDVSKEKKVFKKNVKTSHKKKVTHVEKIYGKWVKK